MGPCPSHELDMNLSTRKYSQGCKREKTLRNNLCEDFPEEATLRQDSQRKKGLPGRGTWQAEAHPHAGLAEMGNLG